MRIKLVILTTILLASCSHYTYSSESYLGMVKEMCTNGVKSYSPITGSVTCYDEKP